jgi:hypothetical protein
MQTLKTYTSQNLYVRNIQVTERGPVFNVTITKLISAQNGDVTGCIVTKHLS